MIVKSLKALAAAALMSVVLPAAGRAADLPPVPDSSDWKFTVAVYGWAAGLKGDVGVFGLPPKDVDLPFSDIIQDLNGAVMGLAEAHNGRFMIGADVTYTNVQSTVKTPFDKLASKIDITNTALMLTGLAGYAVVDEDAIQLDAVVGGRYWNVNNDFDVKGGLLGGRSKSDGASWFDPLVGAKMRVDLSPKFYTTGWAMIGGFGVGSDLMWDLMGGAGYQFNDTFSMFAGYRAVSVDYSNDGFVYDVVEQGPVLAGVFQF